MKMPGETKFVLWGAVVGAVLISVIGFSWFGWVTGGTAQEMAEEQANAAVVKALVPFCVERSNRDPERKKRIAALKEKVNWERGAMLVQIGWADMSDSEDINREIGDECMEKIAKSFTK